MGEDSSLQNKIQVQARVTLRPAWHFDNDNAERLIKQQYAIHDLAGFGCADVPLVVSAAGCLLQYVQETQRTLLPHLLPPQVEYQDDCIVLDAISRRNLELETDLNGCRDHSLLNIIDTTSTCMGGRLLRRWLHRPVRNQETLRLRHDAIKNLLSDRKYIQFHELLRGVGDIERILSRIALASARPRDLTTLRHALAVLPELAAILESGQFQALRSLTGSLNGFPSIYDLLKSAIIEEPPLLIRDGGVIAKGYDEELDRLRSLSENASGFLQEYEVSQREQTGISSLKVGYNRVHGYYIEITHAHQNLVPVSYTRKQTLKAAERYITEELKTFEDQVLSSRERALAREKHCYSQLLSTLLQHIAPLQLAAHSLASLDVLCAFTERARSLQFSCPSFTDQAGINITAGRHPVVEHLQEQPFTANDLAFNDERRMLIITGPNMGGKSTYMRQTALIVLLAQAGSWVPASSAKIGPIDRVFTRIGAGDDLVGGRSTFMVEMSETANILHNASPNSLVLMDEIGRGTSTYDGLALAWACAVFLARKVKAFTLFATHYFELTQLAENEQGVANVHLDAVEHKDRIVFLHSVQDGPASQSYGLQVAALAGIPRPVLQQARHYLAELEKQQRGDSPQLGLFDQRGEETSDYIDSAEPDQLRERLDVINPDDLSPREALELIYELKKLDS